jgi:endonuclease-3
MDRNERACEVMRRLAAEFPEAHIALDFDTPFHLLIAVILSAQTTDVGVNKVTPILFARFPEPRDLAEADPDEVKAIILK